MASAIIWMTVPEMAKYMSIGRKYAYQLVRTGTIPAHRISARKTLVNREDIDNYIASKR